MPFRFGRFFRREPWMNKVSIPLFMFLLAFALVLWGCTQDASEGDEDLAPHLFQDSLRIDPNPAWLYEDATFYFGWEDFDGDMESPALTVSFEDEDGKTRFIEIDEIEAEGETGGAVWFDLKILDGFEGTYTITATDKDGNLSNEIEIFLFVNPIPRIDEEDGEIPFQN